MPLGNSTGLTKLKKGRPPFANIHSGIRLNRKATSMHIIFHDWGKNHFCFSPDLLVIFWMLDYRIILPLQRSIYSAFWTLPIIKYFVRWLSCLIVVYIITVLASWNLKKGQWDGQLLKPQEQLALHCAIIGCFHSGASHDSVNCDQPLRVHGSMGCDSRSIFHKSYPSAKSAKIHVNRHSPMCKAACLGHRELVRAPWQAGLVRLGLRQMFCTSQLVFLGYSIYLV